jgi:hypothetical protein
MTGPINAGQNFCPFCGGILSNDTNICRFCADDLTDSEDAQNNANKTNQTPPEDTRPAETSNFLIFFGVVGVGVVCFLIIGLVGGIIYFIFKKDNQPTERIDIIVHTDNGAKVLKPADEANANVNANVNSYVNTYTRPSSPAAKSEGYLSQAEMLSLMQNKGLWDPWDGRMHKYESIEILRVGSYNEEKKYYPVQVRVKQTMMDGKTWVWVWDCRIAKNDYGDWIARKPL